MAYRDENGKITIDDVAAGEDIKKNRAGTGYPAKCTAEPEAKRRQKGKFERSDPAQAIYDKSQELISQIQRLDNNLEETTNYIRHVLTCCV